MAAVKTVSLTKEYSNGEHYLRAVDDISFTVEENEFVAIMGSSGCGKTTLLNLLGGLENPTHGCVYINTVIYGGKEFLQKMAYWVYFSKF